MAPDPKDVDHERDGLIDRTTRTVVASAKIGRNGAPRPSPRSSPAAPARKPVPPEDARRR